MNATYFFTDFDKQHVEYAQLERLKAKGLFQACGFIGLYGNASALAAADLDAQNLSIWQTLSAYQEVYVCPSAAGRRGIDAAPPNPPPRGLRWLSLAGMLERMTPHDCEPQAISVRLSSDSDLARTEALELCLAALALDFDVQLSLRGPGILGLQRSLARAGAKGYASLTMFGLAYALIAQKEISALPFTLLPESLSLPWQLGEAVQVPLMFEF